MKRIRAWLALWLEVASLLVLSTAQSQEQISHGRFVDVQLYRPAAEVKDVVLFLSGEDGWNAAAAAMAQSLVAEGALVAGISVPQLFENLATEAADCVMPDGDLENLSHFLQGYAKLPTYHTPVLVGYSSGAALAYAMLAQAPGGTFAGAVSLGFCPALNLSKPLCHGEGLRFRPRKDAKGVDLLRATSLPAPWTALHGAQDQACSAAAVRSLMDRVPEASLVLLPKVGGGYPVTQDWMPQFLDAYRTITSQQSLQLPQPPVSLRDLPVIEVASSAAGSRFAILWSGDGGWAGLDRDVAKALAAHGIPVVGVDALRYFWKARTPAGLANDLDRLIRFYAARWSKSEVLLVGYSQGADVLPFALNRLPADAQARIARTVLIGLGERAAFEFHLSNWLGGGDDGLPILPETQTLQPASTVCIYGLEDKDSVCPRLPAGRVTSQGLPGGHHFRGDYDLLARTILAGLPP